MLPDLLDAPQISHDAKERAKYITSQMSSNLGSYSADSRGDQFIRKSIA